MKLTCVTAVFNAVKSGNRDRLIRCIKSVAELKTDHEHLVYDGCSDDGTAEILKELELTTPNLKVVSERDTGLYNALNKGVRDAKGVWFYVLGCDDYIIDPKSMDRLLSSMPDADLVATPTYLYGRDGIETNVWKRRRFFTGMPYSHQGAIMLTSVIREYDGFNEKFRIAADYDLVTKFHRDNRRIVYTGKAYGLFTTGEGTLSASGGSERFTAQDVVIENFGLKGQDAVLYREKLQLPWFFMIRMLFHRDPTIRLASLSMMIRKLLNKGIVRSSRLP